MPFPKDFLWGTATSAGQIEGGAFDDGRTASIWDTFAAKPGKTHNGELPTVACDSYHKFDRLRSQFVSTVHFLVKSLAPRRGTAESEGNGLL